MHRRLGLALVAASLLVGAVVYGAYVTGAVFPAKHVRATSVQPTRTTGLSTRVVASPTRTQRPTALPATSTSTPTPTPLPLGLVEVTSFRFAFEASSEGEQVQIKGVWTTTAVYLKRTTTGADGSTAEVEVYYVDGTLYTNQAGRGQKSQFDAHPTQVLEALGVFDFNRLLQEAQAAGDLDLSPVGPAEVRGVTCTKYGFVDRGAGGMDEGLLYLGRDDGLIYRLEDVAAGTVLEYWDYNVDVAIEPPV